MSPAYGEGDSGDGPYGGGGDPTVWSLGNYRLQSSSLAFADGRLFTGGLGPDVYAVDATSAAVDWEFSRSGSLVDSSPALDADHVYVGSGSGTLYAIDRTDGIEAWSLSGDSAIVSSPTLADGTLYVGDNRGRVRAIDVVAREVDWTRSLDAPVYSRPAVGTNVYVTATDGTVAALGLVDGAQTWSRSVVNLTDFRAAPVLADGVVIVGGADLRALDATDGSDVWTVGYGGSGDSTPVVADGTVYAGDDAGTVTAVDAASGSVSWTADVGSAVRASVARLDGVVYAGTDGGDLVALDAADGTELDRWAFGGRITSPTTAGNIVYVPTWNGSVYAVAHG